MVNPQPGQEVILRASPKWVEQVWDQPATVLVSDPQPGHLTNDTKIRLHNVRYCDLPFNTTGVRDPLEIWCMAKDLDPINPPTLSEKW